MPLNFSNRQPRPALGPRTLLRLGSLVIGLVLIVGLMQSITSPRTVVRLGNVFGHGGDHSTMTSSPAQQAIGEELLAKVDHELLKTLDDDKPFRPAETEAWHHLLAIARDATPEQLHHASVGPVTYAQLISQPDQYRGRVVSISGLAYRIEAMDQKPNELGIAKVYEVIVQPSASSRVPVACHCLELPPGYEVGDTPRPIRFDGFFLKNRVYPHAQGLDKMPVIVARTFEPLDAASPASQSPSQLSMPWMAALIGFMVLLVGWFLWQALSAPPPISRGVGSATDDDPQAVAAALQALEQEAESESREGDPTA